MKNSKLKFKKFIVSKLTNTGSIMGGGDGDGTDGEDIPRPKCKKGSLINTKE